VFNADRQPYVAIGDACLRLFLGRELRVGSAGWMNGERASVADVGDVIKQLQRVDEFAAGVTAAFEFEANQSAVSTFEIYVCASLYGDIAAPTSRNSVTLALRMYAIGPSDLTACVHTAP